MAYLPHCKVILNGVLGASALSGNEIWSTGHQISDTSFAGLPSQAQCDLIGDAWHDCFQDSLMNVCNNAYLTSVRVVAIAADGSWRKNTDGSWMARYGGVSHLPTNGSAAVAREYPVSSVTSLMTSRAGAHGRGRMYWPLPAEAPDGTGYASSVAAGQRAQIVATAFQTINTALATGTYLGEAVVASSAGFLSKITNVRCGNVHDTQRRRRNNLTEVYSVHAV